MYGAPAKRKADTMSSHSDWTRGGGASQNAFQGDTNDYTTDPGYSMIGGPPHRRLPPRRDTGMQDDEDSMTGGHPFDDIDRASNVSSESMASGSRADVHPFRDHTFRPDEAIDEGTGRLAPDPAQTSRRVGISMSLDRSRPRILLSYTRRRTPSLTCAVLTILT